MSTHLVPFAYDDRLIRTQLDEEGAVWFVAKDVCDLLGIQNVSDVMAKQVDDDERRYAKIYPPQRPDGVEVNLLSESGVYTLILRSNKPEARPFRRWVTHEVLPALRRTGAYAVPRPATGPEVLDRAARELRGARRLARAIGYRGADELRRANAAVLASTGLDCLAYLQVEADELAPPPPAPALDLVPFVSQRCRHDLRADVEATALYHAYRHWAHQQGEAPASQGTFGRTLQALGFRRSRGTGGRHRYHGLDLAL
jgi:prophage antirepressor-like protein